MLLEDEIILYSIFVVGVLGLIGCSIVLHLTRTSELKNKDYISFIVCRTLVDLFMSLHCILLQPFGIAYWPDKTLCDIAGSFCTIFASAMAFLEPLLTFNRYIAIGHTNSYQKYFSKRNIYLMFFLGWLLAVLFSAPHFIAGNLGKTEGFMCQVQLYQDRFWIYMFADYVPVFVSFILVLIIHGKMYRHHKKMPHHQTNSDDRNILNYLNAVAILPIITSLPISICCIIYLYTPGIIPNFIFSITTILFFSAPIFSSMAALYFWMKKPFLYWIKRVFLGFKKNAVHPIQPKDVLFVNNYV